MHNVWLKRWDLPCELDHPQRSLSISSTHSFLRRADLNRQILRVAFLLLMPLLNNRRLIIHPNPILRIRSLNLVQKNSWIHCDTGPNEESRRLVNETARNQAQ